MKRGHLELRKGTPPAEVRKGRGSWWWWVIVAANGQVLATSETYARRNSAVAGMRAAVAVIGARTGEYAGAGLYLDAHRGLWLKLTERS